jgi:capsular exopolysaccharide synthesis family protein
MMLNLLLGLAAGAAAGLLLALLRHHLDRRLRTADDIRAITGVSPLGSTVAPGAADDDPLVAMSYRSAEAEQYRTIRTALKFADPDHELHHFVVSSPAEGDGRTSMAANLAISWALAGAAVCLVDAGVRQPLDPRVLGVESGAGLSDVLLGEIELDTVLTSWHDGLLTVLPAGALPRDPVELLGSDAMGHLVAELRSRFDIVIYDAGPMLAYADAAVLARAVDGLVLVVRAGVTTRDQLLACLEKVREARLNLLGTVWFDVTERRWAWRKRDLPVEQERRPAAARAAGSSRHGAAERGRRRSRAGAAAGVAGTRGAPVPDAVGEHRHGEEDDERRGGVEHAALQHAHERDEQGQATD